MLLAIVKVVAVLLAAGILGNLFLEEVKKSKRTAGPWYRPYLSLPGLLVIAAILLPVIYWMINR